MKSADDVEAYLLKMQLQAESPRPGMWVVKTPGADVQNFVISVSGPVIVFRIKVMDLPTDKREELYRTLLELNATEMLHGAYGLEGDAVVLTDCLQLENLDFNEFQATFDEMTMALSNHYQRLAKFRAAA
jgi:hypothetical protein